MTNTRSTQNVEKSSRRSLLSQLPGVKGSVWKNLQCSVVVCRMTYRPGHAKWKCASEKNETREQLPFAEREARSLSAPGSRLSLEPVRNAGTADYVSSHAAITYSGVPPSAGRAEGDRTAAIQIGRRNKNVRPRSYRWSLRLSLSLSCDHSIRFLSFAASATTTLFACLTARCSSSISSFYFLRGQQLPRQTAANS